MARVQSKIRDNMDGILESAGFFRKHVASEPDSLYRAVADVLLGSQVHKDRVAWAVADLRKSDLGAAIAREESDLQLRELRLVAVAMGASVRVVSSNDSRLSVTEFEADGSVKTDVRDEESAVQVKDDDDLDGHRVRERSAILKSCSVSKRGLGQLRSLMPIVGPVEHGGDECRPKFERTSSAKDNLVLLCFTAPTQYDPIYDLATIESAGFVQSMLYELLYQRVLDMPDAMRAADEMLNGDFDPQRGKPDFFDADFKGSAMDALRAFRIPFPYKVAKTLDPNAYRNIEYDVWHCDKKRSTSNPSSPFKRNRNNNNVRSIGRLKRGTPCIVRDSPNQRDLFGLVDGVVEEDKRYVYVHVPSVEVNLRVLRKCVLPLKELPTDVRDAWANYSMRSFLPTCQWDMESRRGNGHNFPGGSLLPQLHSSPGYPPLQYDLSPLGLQFNGLESSTHSLLPFSNSCRGNELMPAIFDRQTSALHSPILPPGLSTTFAAPKIDSGGYMHPSSPFLPSPLALGNSGFIGSYPTPHSETGCGWNGGYQFFQYPPASPMIGPSTQVFLPQMQPPVSPFDFTHLVQALNQGN